MPQESRGLNLVYRTLSGTLFNASTVLHHVRPLCCVKAHTIMRCPVEVFNEFRVGCFAHQKLVQPLDVVVVSVLCFHSASTRG
jgi:hypothetical protein